MASFFRGTTQSTPFQQAIEKVTDGNQLEEDWGTIMKICDHVAVQDESAKEAMKVIRKRLQFTAPPTEWRSVSLTLTLLEALAKNCGKVFHVQLAQKDFLKELRDLIGPKNNPPPAIQDKVLGMIQTWALAFRDDPDLRNVEQFYQECKQQGLPFPPADPENIIKAAVPAKGTIERPSRQASQPGMNPGPGQNRSGAGGPAQHAGQGQTVIRQMTPEQIAKLRSELDVVQNNAQVFGEMLVTLQPGEEHPQDLDLLLELQKTCKQMQARIFDLLSQISIDEITVDLLRYNDEFNNSFKTFESYMQERERRVGPTPNFVKDRTASPTKTSLPTSQSSVNKTSTSPGSQNNEPALIKFDEEPPTLSAGVQNLRISPPSSDLLTKTTHQQSTRQMNIDSATVTTRAAANPNQSIERDVQEMEQWLNSQDRKDADTNSASAGGTSPAFDAFIQKRASTIPDEATSDEHNHLNLQPAPNQPHN